MPDFNFNAGGFPIASVIDAMQRKAALQNEFQNQQTQLTNQAIGNIGTAASDIVNQRQRIAQSLALGKQYGISPTDAANLTPEQIGQYGSNTKGMLDISSLMGILRNSAGGGNPGGVVPASAPGSPPQASPAILASNTTQTPVPTPQSPGLDPNAPAVPPGQPGQPPAQPGGPPPTPPSSDPTRRRMVSPAGLNALSKIFSQNQQENVATVDANGNLKTIGSVPRGTKVIQSQSVSPQDKEQDRLENLAVNRVSTLRSDASLARTENQRDASIQAFNTIANIKSQDRLPSQIEYYDILGQLWKARTGAAPSDQAIQDLDARTFKGDLGKAQQYFTGKPAGRTTSDVLNNIEDFVKQTGQQADKLHAGYMQSHLIKPQGLKDERWQPIVNTQRGLSFADATKGAEPDIHDQAIQWAQDHPNDPRSGPILQKALNAKGSNGPI